MRTKAYVDAKNYCIKILSNVYDCDNPRVYIQETINDAANFFAKNREEYQEIYDNLAKVFY